MAVLQKLHDPPETPPRLRYADIPHIDLFLFMHPFSDVLTSNGRSHIAIPRSLAPARVPDVAASEVAADMLKLQPLGEEAHRLGMASIHLWHVLQQLGPKRILNPLEMTNTQVGLDQVTVSAEVAAPQPSRIWRLVLKSG